MSYEITLPLLLQSADILIDSPILSNDGSNLIVSQSINDDKILVLSKNIHQFDLNPNFSLVCNAMTNSNNLIHVDANMIVSDEIFSQSINFDSTFDNILTVNDQNLNNYSLIFPNNVGLNGDLLLTNDLGFLTWQTPALQLFNSAIRISSIVNDGTGNYGIKLVPSASVQYFTPNAPLITITNLGGSVPDVINIPSGCTALRIYASIQVQFSPFPSPSVRSIVLVANTNSGSLSRNVSSSVPPGSNNWRTTLLTELQGVTSTASFQLLWGFPTTVVTFNTGFISIQYYYN